jgi:hypothetical protein
VIRRVQKISQVQVPSKPCPPGLSALGSSCCGDLRLHTPSRIQSLLVRSMRDEWLRLTPLRVRKPRRIRTRRRDVKSYDISPLSPFFIACTCIKVSSQVSNRSLRSKKQVGNIMCGWRIWSRTGRIVVRPFLTRRATSRLEHRGSSDHLFLTSAQAFLRHI